MKKKKQFRRDVHQSSKNSRLQQERCYLITKKMLRHFELDPALVDVFTKKQKERLFRVFFEPPIVKPDKEKTVPRQYVKLIHAEMYQFMKTTFYGNPENQLTYIDFAIYGMSFLLNLSNEYKKFKKFLPGTPQGEAANEILENANFDDLFHNGFSEVFDEVWHLTKSLSRVNFRFYGFKFKHEPIKLTCGCCTALKMTIRLTAKDSVSKKFTYNNIERRAFQLYFAHAGILNQTPIGIKRNNIFPKAKESESLNLYIQSHVLQRIKERLDDFPPETLNLLIQNTFFSKIKIVKSHKQFLFACMEDGIPLGYFTFFIQNDDLVINTFLPLVSPNTPEGKKLHELLPLSKEDIVYLGMDKTSFYLQVDFEQIPILKQALIDSNIWLTKMQLEKMAGDEIEEKGTLIDANKTMFVKNFFDKYQAHRQLEVEREEA